MCLLQPLTFLRSGSRLEMRGVHSTERDSASTDSGIFQKRKG